MLYPLIWLLVARFSPTTCIFAEPGLLPAPLSRATTRRAGTRWPTRSPLHAELGVVVVLGRIVGNLVVLLLAAYAFARLKFRRQAVSGSESCCGTMMLPSTW